MLLSASCCLKAALSTQAEINMREPPYAQHAKYIKCKQAEKEKENLTLSKISSQLYLLL